MKQIALIFMIVFSVTATAVAQEHSESYNFIHDLIDCLKKLETGVSYYNPLESDPVVERRNLESYVAYIRAAKEIAQPWLGPYAEVQAEGFDEEEAQKQASPINTIGYAVFNQLLEIEKNLSDNINLSGDDSIEAQTARKKNFWEIKNRWETLYQEIGKVFFLISDLNAKGVGAIGRKLSDADHQQLLNYVNWIFKKQFEAYNAQARGEVTSVSGQAKATFPTYCALQIKKFLIVDSYEELHQRNKSDDPLYFEDEDNE